MGRLSVFIIAYNEADKIRDAIESVLWADEILLVDSFSKDNTAEIAASLGAKVIQVPFQGFGNLRNQAIAACSHEWIFSLDADERMTEEAKTEIQKILQAEKTDSAYFVPRKNLFMGRWIKHSWPYPNYRQPQLFKKEKMCYANDEVHEGYIMLDHSKPGKLKQAIWQFPFKSLAEIITKMNRYSDLNAEKSYRLQKKISIAGIFGHAFWSFFKNYILKRGFLDGWPGFIIAFSNFEGTFYRYAKLKELWRKEK